MPSSRAGLPLPPVGLRLAVLVFVCLSGMWAVTSPLGSVPDEPAHVIYAASVVRGQLGDGPLGHVVRVPATVGQASNTTCPAFRPFVTADCIEQLAHRPGAVVTETSAGRYPPLYYALVGWPTLVGFGDGTWLVMRLLSVALAGLLLWVGASCWRRGSGAVAAGVLVAGSPMATFMVGSVNPNGAEIAAGVAFALAVTGLLDRWRRGDALVGWRPPTAVALTGGYLGVARPGSHLLLVALAGVLALFGLREVGAGLRRRDMTLLAPVAVLLGAVVVAVVYARLAAAPGALLVAHPVGLRTALATIVNTFAGYTLETAGIFGWRDHLPPLQLRMLWIGMSAALAVAAWFSSGWRERLALGLLVVGSFLLAPLFVYLTLFRDGVGYQARYAMALTQAVPILAAAVLSRRATAAQSPAGRALASIPIVTLVVQLLVLAGSYLRYAVGLPLQLNPLALPGDVRWVPAAWPLDLLFLVAATTLTVGLVRTLRAEPVPAAGQASAVR
jgi:hypothetical protein